MYFPCVTANEKSPFQVITFRRNTNAGSRPGAGKELAKPLTVIVGFAFEQPMATECFISTNRLFLLRFIFGRL